VTCVTNAVRLDFGYSSSAYPTRVNDLMAAALPGTVALMGTAIAWRLGCLLDPRSHADKA